MTKREFLDNLRMALSGRVSASSAEEHIRYYEDYINTQVRMGRGEQDVIAELGDPRLLARSIEDAEKRAGNAAAQDGYQDSYAEKKSGRQNDDSYNGGYQESGRRGRTYRVHGWLILLIVLLIVFLVIGLAFSILSFLAPIILPVILIVLAVRLFRRV